ncbi:nucleotide exchange factor GrpE [Magnetovibrio blakemorei]|uniref:Protein GrpE n=1 Tax=Magnetovibrio blakemorei TaxID=28181 RepID=A0A1E5Q3M9_9PROT|nr:nucleotide exchange factor GrpE [Magnetovibrio blakemorei]OEJ64392.1 nucleotide exchange factor GrpE [Magnetovibrio blakemorei]
MNTENEVSADETSEPSDQDLRNAQADAQNDSEREAEVEAFEAEGDIEPEAETDGPDLAREVQELKDKLLRAMAEAENTRRIAAREKADASKYAVVNFARDIVRVADNLGMAMMMVSEDARKEDKNLDNLYIGIDMTMKELLSIFESHGIKPVPTVGQPFDHNIHEAVQQLENKDVPNNTVLQALRGGFTIQDRLLRPAQVVVSTGGPSPETASEAPGQNQSDGNEHAYEAEGPEPGQNIDQET